MVKTPAETVATPAVEKAPKAKKEKKASPKAEPKAKKGKAEEKKATPKEPTVSAATAEKLGKPRRKILEALEKGAKLTRNEIAEKTGINSGFTSLLGHLEPEKQEEGSLAKLGLIRFEKEDRDGKNAVVAVITAAGKKALEKARKADKE